MISLRFVVPMHKVPPGVKASLLAIMRSDDFSNLLNGFCENCDIAPEPPSVDLDSAYTPVIYITGGDVAYVEANTVGMKFVDAGATCSDDQDGLIYENQKASSSEDEVDESKLGSTNLVYTCRNKDGNEATEAQRFVTVRDTTPPVCKLVGAASVTHEAGFAYTDKGCECQDSYQGSLTPVITNDVDHTRVGTYASHCNAQDASGNKAAAVSRTVIIADTLKPVIALSSGWGQDKVHIAQSDSSDTSTLGDDSVVNNPAGDYLMKQDGDLWGAANLNPV